MPERTGARPASRLLIILVLAAVVTLLLWQLSRQGKEEPSLPESVAPPVETEKDTVLAPADTFVFPVSEPTVPDTAVPEPVAEVKMESNAADTAAVSPVDTLSSSDHTVPDPVPFDSCAADTLEPWVYPEPSGGLHRESVTIFFHANKPCSIRWRLIPDTVWRDYDGGRFTLDTSGAVEFTAVDRCGRAMEVREEYYEIDRSRKASSCPSDMDLVEIGGTRFCIDRYEWPNRKGERPLAYVSLYQAMDTCFTYGKRLCTSEEWLLACAGPYGWNYPYGQRFEKNACVTSGTAARPSGSCGECRAWFGTYDMAGNLMEWTSTPSRENRSFNDVMGGFWESGVASGCGDVRYSYFPQNRHNPVGFRCCSDVPAGK